MSKIISLEQALQSKKPFKFRTPSDNYETLWFSAESIYYWSIKEILHAECILLNNYENYNESTEA